MLAPVSHVLPLTLIRRERFMPIAGKLLVRKGQKLSATDVIGEYKTRQDFFLVDVARALGISTDRADQYIQCEDGDLLETGDVIAGPVGFTRRIIRSPRNGVVVLTGGGQVLIEFEEQPLTCKAGLSGEVTELLADRGAVIETTGALIQGVWGNGQIDFGLLNVLASTPDHMLTEDQLDVSQRGVIVLAGHCADAETLRVAGQLPVRGLILGSLSANCKTLAEELSFPILVLEGFGRLAINPVAYKLLLSNERREVSLNCEMADSFNETRPEIVIPLPASGLLSQPVKADYLAAQQKVRVLCSQHARETGTLLQMKGLVTFSNGIQAQAAEILLESGEKAILPLANLEILG